MEQQSRQELIDALRVAEHALSQVVLGTVSGCSGNPEERGDIKMQYVYDCSKATGAVRAALAKQTPEPLSARWSSCRKANNKQIDAIFARLVRERGLFT